MPPLALLLTPPISQLRQPFGDVTQRSAAIMAEELAPTVVVSEEGNEFASMSQKERPSTGNAKGLFAAVGREVAKDKVVKTL